MARLRFKLRGRFTVILVSLAVLPQLIGTVVVMRFMFVHAELFSRNVQYEFAAAMANRLETYLETRVEELGLYALLLQSLPDDAEQVRSQLNNLLFASRAFQELSIVGETGREVARVSRTDAVPASALRDRRSSDAFAVPFYEEQIHFGAVEFNRAIGEPVGTVSVPVFNRLTGSVQSVLIATMRYAAVWNLLIEQEVSPGRDIFVTDEGGLVVAHRDPSVVLRMTTYDSIDSPGRGVGINGRASIVAVSPIGVQGLVLRAVATQEVSSALEAALRSARVAVAAMGLSLLAAIVLVVIATRRIVHPIVSMARFATAVADGHDASMTVSRHPDELGDLANALEQMAAQLGERIQSLHGTVTDRTRQLESVLLEQRQTVRQLRSKQSDLESLIYTLSHDLKSPLITISGFLGYVRQSVDNKTYGAIPGDLTRIEKATAHMQAMLDDLLDVFRETAPRMRRDEIALADLAKEAAENTAGRLMQKRVAIEIMPDMPVVAGDHLQLCKLFENLIDNGAKFMGNQAAPRIEVRAEEDADWITVSVCDNGKGVSPADVDRIFRVFEKLDPATEGSGVGLAICRRIAEAHGGTLWVESNGPGLGSRFAFTLAKRQESTAEEGMIRETT